MIDLVDELAARMARWNVAPAELCASITPRMAVATWDKLVKRQPTRVSLRRVRQLSSAMDDIMLHRLGTPR